MTLDQINAWIIAGESETLEFKRTTGELRSGMQTLCAMLNHRGGKVLFGIGPDRRIVGQHVSDQTIAEIAQESRQVDPPALPSIDRVPVGDGREVIVVGTVTGHNRPYSYRGQPYRRVGNTTQTLSRDEYNRLLLERLHGEHRWENETAGGWDVSDLESAEVVRTVDEAVRRGRAEEPGTRDVAELLRGLGLIRDGNVLRAAAVLFGRAEKLERSYPQCLLRVARFRGMDRTEFLDNRQFHGNAFDLIQRAERFLRDNLPVAGRVMPGLFERVDDPLYPPAALREALANAFCHRDYSIGGGSVALAIYDDRLEVTSSGTLHFGLTAEALFGPHESLPWNPLIARVFYRRGIIESWGRGTIKMIELTQEAGLPMPEIEAGAGAVIVRFHPGRYTAPHRVARDLSTRQQHILELLAEAPRGLAFSTLRARLQPGARDWELRDDLTLLRQLGLIETRGHARGARWYLAATRPAQ